ncbi:MAG: Cof-type HAD-IIB family hydrolase [Ferruginibacter sp.]
MYKAVFIDMDGTLLQSNHTVSVATKHVIHQLTSNGILVVPVSARPLHGMLPITGHVFPAHNPIVSLNGSYILQNDKIVFDAAVQPADALAIHDEIKGEDVSVMYYSRMEWFADVETTLVKKEQKITPVKIIIQPFEQTVEYWRQHNGGVNKILIAGDKDLILEVEEKLLQQHKGKLNIYKSQPRYLEVMNPGASKTKAIQFLLNQYNITPDEIIAIGDNYNDKEMIAFAGKGIAMGNAPDDIKSVAGYVTDTNNNDGVAKALKHFFSL